MKKLIFFLLFASPIMAQDFLPLYPAGIPNSKPVVNKQKASKGADGIERISEVTIPTYRFFPAPGFTKPTSCVVICPGGGYRILASSHEGYDIAAKFNEIGVSALVLYYRLPSDSAQVEKKYAPLQDAQSAIALVRANAAKWNVDPAKVGIMGFSAGGHLAATASTHFSKDYTGLHAGANLRPDFSILLYPVISVRSFGHGGSSQNLLGKNPSEADLALFSNEEQVTVQTPKAFIVHAADDNAVPLKNSLLYAEKLTANKVPVDLHVYAKGGHGFGLNNKTTSGDLWFDRLNTWMKANQLL
ncbi:alpha/beta hydrolase [Aquirufa antheringensis]|jgi:acetyl esterase/lipase|uniref:Alpha/beta hydrolase n=1 Tax=Aquirufa antheringensis TaxID=2516559 RepID=A0A4Q9BBE4_9BACT|nr:alpha/beta hydrolase [Aquirufa antheringensis]MCZ2486243.1 alpha/beta hydrolase [Aquirufa antheringensis]TBH73157.1 alpha/beta hydrolase [Aquirufa antheringensis]